ncbi:hypothetical protein [Streptomyces broussonetiae]|uniref:Uncharacterized protein n=1 Tax=Streptomyces broussonetiae TaxID=2686304 RepID=A0A6I6NGG0_9ACTN|nr:hypothetical protein [Streptomyces broussonetiae]QHA09290.1 hypothetical protein GQF42_44455 [Streptomyces broussonetiae]
MTGPGRYHLLHTIGGRPAQHGWWGNEKVAREKYGDCVGLHRAPGARITLTDEETGTVLTTWPDEQ